MQWNDLVLRDLRDCKLEKVWKNEIKMYGGITSGQPHKKRISKEEKEKDRKDEQKQQRETRETTSKFDIHCSFYVCSFTVVLPAGLVNHQGRNMVSPSLTNVSIAIKISFN